MGGDLIPHKSISQYRAYIFLACSGLALGASVLVPLLWPLALFAVTPALVLLRDESSHRAFFSGIIFGIFHVAVALSWFWFTLPLDWLPKSEGLNALFVVGVPWLVLSFVLALPFGVWGVVVSRSPRGMRGVFIIAGAWVCAELVSALAYSLLTLSDSTFLGMDFSIHWVGYVLAHQNVLLQLAWYGGVCALSFFVLGCNAFFAQMLSKNISLKSGLLLLCSVCILLIVPWTREEQVAMNETRIVSTVSFYADTEDTSAGNVVDIERTLRSGQPDILVFPEGFGVDALFKNPIHIPEHTESIVSEVLFDAGARAGRLAVISSDRTVMQVQDKHFLLPFGEYIPYLYAPFARMLGTVEIASSIQDRLQLTPGGNPMPIRIAGEEMGALFCSENMSPTLYARATIHGAEALFNVSSYRWFHGSWLVFQKMKSIAQVRAVETDRWYVQSSNMAPAFVLDNRGRTIEESLWEHAGLTTATIYLRSSKTPYIHILAFFVGEQ